MGVKKVAPYFFLMNGWKIRPYEGNHTLNLIGNLFIDNPETYGSNVTVPTTGSYNVLVNMSTTSDATTIEVGGGLLESDKTDIANMVWENISGSDISTRVDFLNQYHGQRWKITGSQLIMYNNAGQEIKRFNLFNKQGQPTETQIYERVPV